MIWTKFIAYLTQENRPKLFACVCDTNKRIPFWDAFLSFSLPAQQLSDLGSKQNPNAKLCTWRSFVYFIFFSISYLFLYFLFLHFVSSLYFFLYLSQSVFSRMVLSFVQKFRLFSFFFIFFYFLDQLKLRKRLRIRQLLTFVQCILIACNGNNKPTKTWIQRKMGKNHNQPFLLPKKIAAFVGIERTISIQLPLNNIFQPCFWNMKNLTEMFTARMRWV